jgi:pyruvate dehydrogenase E2 component (dihydrolipoamide acetyltransferase)
MAKSIVMPQVGQDLTEGELIEWNVQVGDTVKKGDILAVVESEKASFEVEAYEEGVVLKLFYEPGDMAVVLEPLLLLGEEDENVEAAASAPSAKAPAGTDQPAEATEVTEASNGIFSQDASVTRSSPLARRIAALNGLDIASIQGSGPKGAVVKKDVESALEQIPSPSAAPVKPPQQAATSQPLPAMSSEDDVEVPFN